MLKYVSLLIIGIFVVLLSLSLGTTFITPGEIIGIFINDVKNVDYNILVKLRIPRIILTLIVGSSLAVSGTVFQALLKNPLADPYIIGISSGAALGAAISILLSANYYMITLTAFCGSIIAVTLVYLLSMKLGIGTDSMILSGLALGFIFSAIVLLLFSLSKSDQVHKAILWLMGDLSMAQYDVLLVIGIVSILLMGTTVIFHKHLDILSFGERFSKNLGITQGSIVMLFWAASLLPALSVAAAGVIGFVGLIMPHIMRNIFGPGHLRLIPMSAVGGALFLLLSDTVARSIAPPFEIPVGIVTSLCGGIFFLVFMIKKKTIK